MEFWFRDNLVFTYTRGCDVIAGKDNQFNMCSWLDSDYKLLSEFFNLVYRDKIGEQVELKDFILD
jgi:hypothetical protein